MESLRDLMKAYDAQVSMLEWEIRLSPLGDVVEGVAVGFLAQDPWERSTSRRSVAPTSPLRG